MATNNKKNVFVLSIFLAVSNQSLSDIFIDTPYQVCFTPAQDCTPRVVDEINKAKNSVYVQAYSFTSKPILNALKKAHTRGIDVEVILDKGQYSKKGKYTSATFLTNASIPVWVDTKVAIAHNKVMIFDDEKMLIGSFNFTASANNRNAENLIIIENDNLAKQYKQNWESRREVSIKIN